MAGRKQERTAEDIQRERATLRTQYGELFDWLAQALFEDDPVGINLEENTDEYEPEVGTILPRLAACTSALDVRAVVHEEFCQWFTPSIAGPLERYTAVSSALWERLQAGRRP